MEDAKKAKKSDDPDRDDIISDPFVTLEGMEREMEMASNDPIEDMLNDLMGGGVKVRPMMSMDMDIEEVTVED